MTNLTLEDAIEIANVGVEFGKVVGDATRYPMDVTKMNALLNRMKPYREIFEPIVQASVDMLNQKQPRPDGAPRFDYKIE